MISVLMLCFYIVVEVVRPEVLFTDGGGRILLWTSIAVTVAWLGEKLAGNKPWRSFPSTSFMIGLILVGAASSLVASYRGYPDSFTKFEDLFKAVFIYFMASQILDTERRLDIVRWVLICAISWVAIGGILFSQGHNLPGFNYDQSERLQYSGVFNDANDLGMLYLVAFGMLLFGVFNRPGPFRKLLFGAWAAIPAWGILLTASRGAMLGVGAAVIVAIRRRSGILIPALVAGILLIAANRFGVARMDQFASDEESAEGRIRSWAQGWYMLRSNPLLGVGPRNYTEEHPVAPHNTIVQVTAEMGMAGLFCWIGFFYFPLQEYVKIANLRHAATGTPLALQQLQAGLLPAFVAGLFLSRAYIIIPYLLAAMVLAAREIAPEDAAEEGTVYASSLSFARLAMLVVGILLAWRVLARQFITGI